MKGIDVSNHQGNIDFSKVGLKGIDLAYIKASEGKTYQDPYFARNYDGFKAIGVKVGAYHFLRTNDTVDEINNLLGVIGNRQLDVKVAIDVEIDLGGIDATSQKVRAFADALIAKGYQPMLYTYKWFYDNNLNDTVKDLPLWIAQYGGNQPTLDSYVGWQYSDAGQVDGINVNVDLNDFREAILIGKSKESVENNFLGVSKLDLIKLGEESGSVKLLQGILNVVLSINLTEDGKFGPITKEAVESYQHAMKITVDGEVGEETAGTLLKDIKINWFKFTE